MFLWWRIDPPRLPPRVTRAVAEANEVYVSAVSAWEAAIKSSLGRLRLPDPVERGVDESGFRKLMVTFRHAEAVASLPRLHGDLFDRLLVAQARIESLILVTADRELRSYDVDLLTF